MKKITQTPSKCIGCMMCVGLCPEIFEFDQTSGKAKLKKGQPVGEAWETTVADDTANVDMLEPGCCGGAIKVTDEA